MPASLTFKKTLSSQPVEGPALTASGADFANNNNNNNDDNNRFLRLVRRRI